MRSTAFPMLAFVTLLATGCSTTLPIPEPDLGPYFCDVEEVRRFSQAEIDWRAENAPWNLRRDLKTNATFEREC